MKKKIIFLLSTLILMFSISCGAITDATDPDWMPPEFEITFLDKDLNGTLEHTTIIMMKVKDPKLEGLTMVSKKLDSGEYRVYITDRDTDMGTTLYHDDGVLFPRRMTYTVGEEMIDGYVLKHNKTDENFDIVWTDSAGQKESQIDIPLKNDIYDYGNFDGFSTTENYQINTMLIGLRVLTAVVEHADSEPTTRLWGWLKKILAVVLVIVAVVVAVIFPPAIVFVKPIIAIAGILINGPAEMSDQLSKPEPNESKKMIVNIEYPHDKNILVVDKEGEKYAFYTITDSHSGISHEEIEFDIIIPGALIKSSLKIHIKGEENAAGTDGLLLAYYDIYFDDNGNIFKIGTDIVFSDNTILPPNELGGNYSIKLKKIYNEEIDKEVYLLFETENEYVSINDNVKSQFRIRIE